MKLYLEKGTSVEEIRRIFTTCYPYLKIELYKKPFKSNVSVKKELLPSSATFDKYLHTSGKTCIDINNEITVSQLEQYFEDAGVNAEIFRKSGNVWVETSLTDNWTLEQQNAEGEELSKQLHAERKFTPRGF